MVVRVALSLPRSRVDSASGAWSAAAPTDARYWITRRLSHPESGHHKTEGGSGAEVPSLRDGPDGGGRPALSRRGDSLSANLLLCSILA